MTTKAVVLAGGGVGGIAWMVGLAEALREGGVVLEDGARLVGTSAGSVVATILATDSLAHAIAMNERAETTELAVSVDLASFFQQAAAIWKTAKDARDELQQFGAYALAADTIDEARRRAVVAARLPVQDWPAHPLAITAIDARAGERVVFDRASGVPLVDAVCASCAVPGVWPPHTIGARRFVDGGTYSFTNADLARGADRTLVVVPVALSPLLDERFARERDQLGDVKVVRVDADGLAAIGPNPLDPSRRKLCLDAGRARGRALAGELRAFWH